MFQNLKCPEGISCLSSRLANNLIYINLFATPPPTTCS
jgi:hypothetical protein